MSDIKIGSAWKTIEGCQVKIASAWKTVTSIKVKIAGVWEEVLESVFLPANITVNQNSVSTEVRAGFRVNSDGTIDKYTLAGGYVYYADWIVPSSAAPGAYQVRVTSVSFSSGSWYVNTYADDAWGVVSASPEWIVRDASSTGAGNTSMTCTLEIREGTGATIDTSAVSLIAIYDAT